MTPQQIEAMIKAAVEASGGPPWWVHLLLVVGAGLAAYFGAYLGEKAKYRAMAEEIGKITKIVEEVRTDQVLMQEDHKSYNQLRLAAMDKRLQAHQEAFTRWRLLMRTVHNDEARDAVLECQDWWERNCVYLSKESSEAFVSAYAAAADHRMLIQAREPAGAVTSNFKKLVSAGNIILNAVALPGLPEPALKPIVASGFPTDPALTATAQDAPQ